MSRERAMYYISGFRLLPDEERYIIEREVNGHSVVQIALENSTSVRAVQSVRKRAFQKIADAIAFREEKSRG